MTALRTLSRAMFYGFVRDRTAVFFTILFPLMFLFLFGGIFKDQSAPRPKVAEIGQVQLLDAMPAAARQQLAKALDLTQTADRASALERVRKGDLAGAVEQQGGLVTIHYSVGDQVKAATVQGVLQALVQQANVAATGAPPRFRLAGQQVEDQSLKTIQFVTPGLLGWAIATGATFGAALTLVTWRQKKILRRLRLAPVRTATVVGARVGVSMAVALIQTAIFIGIARTPYFGLQLSAWWWLSVPLVLAGTLAFLSIGLLVGAFAKTPESASAAVNLIVLPMGFLSGAFFPLDNAPGWLQAVSKVLPLRYLVDGMKNVMVRGDGPASIMAPIGLLLAFALLLSLLATRLFRWDDV